MQEQLTKVYSIPNEDLDFEDNFSDVKSTLEAEEPTERDGAEEYDFRLFAKSTKAAQPWVRDRIILRSPTPNCGDTGFVKARRPDAYYFTGQTSEALQERYRQSTISGHQLLQGLDVVWVWLLM